MPRVDRNPPEQILLHITEAMTERTAPSCQHFGTCGGCQLQHLPAQQQLLAKEAMLVDVLHNAGIKVLPPIQAYAAEPLRYRNRARFRVEGDSIGYSRHGSNTFLAINECPIVSPLVWQCAATLCDLAAQGLAHWPAGIVSFEVFANHDDSQLQLSLQLGINVLTIDREAPGTFRTLCQALKQQLPQLAGAGLSVAAAPDTTQPKRVQEAQRVEIARWGDTTMPYVVCDRTYTNTRNAFFQVNRFLTQTMVHLVTDGRSGKLAWDLFAGAGLFSVALAERFHQVIAVEIGEPAASDLAAHLAAAGPSHRAERSTTLAFLQKHAGAQVPDLIVLDPPRAGLGMATVQALIRANAREIVYVSCDAGSFARDARPLVESGYTLQSLQLLDLFPQTVHTETIAVFRR